MHFLLKCFCIWKLFSTFAANQEQLGEMVGVQKAQISRLENGKNLTIATIARLFKALNQQVSLDIPSIGRIALW